MLQIDDHDRARLITFDRPDRANAFNEELYHASADALRAAAGDDAVGAVVFTGAGKAFCAGTDLLEMASRMSDPDFVPGRHGFPGMIDHLLAFDKPVICAVNGLGRGTRQFASTLKYIQSGQFQTYGAVGFTGLLVAAVVVLVLNPV